MHLTQAFRLALQPHGLGFLIPPTEKKTRRGPEKPGTVRRATLKTRDRNLDFWIPGLAFFPPSVHASLGTQGQINNRNSCLCSLHAESRPSSLPDLQGRHSQ